MEIHLKYIMYKPFIWPSLNKQNEWEHNQFKKQRVDNNRIRKQDYCNCVSFAWAVYMH